MKEVSSLLLMFLKLFLARPGSGVIIVFGVAGLTAIVTSLFAVSTAFEGALASTGQPDRALLLRAGSTSEINGNVALNQYEIVRDMAGLLRLQDKGVASRETYVTANLRMKNSSKEATLPLRGVEAAAFTVRPEVSIVSGATFDAGKYELIAGVKAAQTFAGLEVGQTIRIRGQEYLVRGHFSAEGGANETELWMDERLLAATLGRGETFSSIIVRLESAREFESFQAQLAADRRLTLSAYRESSFYEDLAGPTTSMIQTLGLLVGIIMSIGALAAGVNSMQAALESRTREIATLRALGFGRVPVLTAVLAECAVLSLIGAGAALVGVFVLLDGQTLSTVAASTTSGTQVAFEFDITGESLAIAGLTALSLGVLGGLMPGIAAIRRPIPQALRG